VRTDGTASGMRPACRHCRRAKPHDLAARIGHLEEGSERGLRRLKLELDLSMDLMSLGLRRAAEKGERQNYSGADGCEHVRPLSAIFLLSATFGKSDFCKRFRHAQFAATTIGCEAGIATGEPL